MRQSPFINIFARDFGWGIVIKRNDVWFTRMFLRNKLNWLKILFGSNPYTYLFHLFVIVRYQSILPNFMFWTNYQSVRPLMEISSISCSPTPEGHHILPIKSNIYFVYSKILAQLCFWISKLPRGLEIPYWTFFNSPFCVDFRNIQFFIFQ